MMKSIVTCAVGLLSLGAFCGDAQTVRMTPCGGAQVSPEAFAAGRSYLRLVVFSHLFSHLAFGFSAMMKNI